MANLSRERAKELISSPKNGLEIAQAKAKKRRNNLHTQPVVDIAMGSLSHRDGHREFLQWIKSILGNKQNYDRYENLYRPPVPTNELVESIYSEFKKVFEAENAFFKFEFSDPEAEVEFDQYRQIIADKEFMEQDGFSAFKSSIDSFVVIDMPDLEIENDQNPILDSESDNLSEPYPYIVDIMNVVDADTSKKRIKDPTNEKTQYSFNCEYLIFRDTDIRVIVIDDTFYRAFIKDENGDWNLQSESAHDLGFCPAKSFWNTPLNNKSMLQKLGQIDNSLSELDWLLFWTYARKYLEMYAAFPIYAKFREKCNYVDEAGRKCQKGHIIWTETDGIGKSKNHKIPCPECANGAISPGPGNTFLVDVPQANDQPNLMETPVKVIPAEITSLEYCKERERELKENIFQRSVGQGGEPINDQAQNEKQIHAHFESRQNVLTSIKRNFEIIHHFILDTTAKLRYGSLYIKGTVNYGDEMFLKDVESQQRDYKAAKENGLPMYELANRRQMIDHTKYKNNLDRLQRTKILSQIEPFPDLTLDEIGKLKRDNLLPIDDRQIALKVHFNSLIQRFEREQTSILKFGALQPMAVRISIIKDRLMSYVNEMFPADVGPLGHEPDNIESDSKSNLRGSVGGLQGVLSTAEKVNSNLITRQAGLNTLMIMFGFTLDEAEKLLDSPPPILPGPQSIDTI